MKKWLGNTKCDICGKECEEVLYDAAIRLGPWAIMCEDCFNKFGKGLGIGIGQEYVMNNETGDFEKNPIIFKEAKKK